jgi:hypothetical protein
VPDVDDNPLIGGETDSLSVEVVERSLDGIEDVPLLLTGPEEEEEEDRGRRRAERGGGDRRRAAG